MFGQVVFLCSHVHLLTCVGHLRRFVCGSSGFLGDISAASVALSLSSRVMTGLPQGGRALATPLVGHPVLGLALDDPLIECRRAKKRRKNDRTTAWALGRRCVSMVMMMLEPK